MGYTGLKMIKHDKPLWRKFFITKNLQKKLINNPEECICYCEENFYVNYVDTNYAHTLTGNFNIVTDLELRNYILHGTKYRLTRVMTRNHVFKHLENNVDFFIIKVAERYSLPISSFQY